MGFQKRGFLVHLNEPKGNEDETEIADTTNERCQGNQGSPLGDA